MATNKSLYNYYKILLLKINSIKGDKIIMKKTILDQFKNIRTLNEYYRQETKKVYDNIYLSEIGKGEKIDKLKKEYNEKLASYKKIVINELSNALEKMTLPTDIVTSEDATYQLKFNNALIMFKDGLVNETAGLNIINQFKDDTVALNAFSAYLSRRKDELSNKLSDVIFGISDKRQVIEKLNGLIDSVSRIDVDYLFNLDSDDDNIVDSDLYLSGYEDIINTFSDDMQAIIK